MADIAQRAGVSPGNLCNYVDSKDALYLVLRRMFGEDERTPHLIVELCWWAAGRRHHEPHATDISDAAARQAACSFVAAARTPQ